MKELLVTLREDGHSYLCYNYDGVCECDCQCDCQCDRYCDDRCESCDSCVCDNCFCECLD